MSLRRALSLLVAGLVAVACSSGDTSTTPSSTAPATTTATSSTTATAPSTSVISTTTASSTSTTTLASTTTATTSRPAVTTLRPVCDLSGFSTAEKRNDVVPPAIAGLASVRAGLQDCYERVVFDFNSDSLPNYQIAAASPPFSGPSDQPIAVAGTRFLRLRLGTTYARYPDVANYDGPDVIQPAGFSAIKEIHLIEDFEAVVVWVIGLDGDRSFRVGTLTNPTRIYVDVAR